LKYRTLSEETREVWFSGFEAIIVQHEVDHLDGTLFTKRVLEQNGILYKEKGGELEEYKI
jgi:peptide deformylase